MQPNENNDQICVFLIDESYGGPMDDEELAYEQNFKKLKDEFGVGLEEVDVMPGASLPAFLLVVFDNLPWIVDVLASGLVLKDTAIQIQKIASKLREYFHREIVLNRNAASMLALDAVFNDMGGIPKNIKIDGYYVRDIRDEEVSIETKTETISPSIPTEYLAVSEHVFDITADKVRFVVTIRGKSVLLQRQI
jgi:hypothetical protein